MTLDAFTFEPTAWEQTMDGLIPGTTFSAAQFLTVLEGESEDTLEDAFRDLAEKDILLDISDLPVLTFGEDMALRLRREAKLVEEGCLLTGLEDTDPLRLYLEEIARTPACGDPAVLAEDAAMGDENARGMLLNVSLHRVIHLSQELAGKGCLLLDLIQEGSLGLWEGILSWQGQGDFETYRDRWIRRSLAKTVTMQARAAGVGQKLRQSLEDYRAVDEALLTELGRNATLEEIAQRMHITAQEAWELAEMLKNITSIRRATAPAEEASEDPEEELAVEDTAYFQMRQRVGELLSSLSEQEAKLLTLRFGLEGGLPKTPQQTGDILRMTAEEVVAMEAAALAKLRNE